MISDQQQAADRDQFLAHLRHRQCDGRDLRLRNLGDALGAGLQGFDHLVEIDRIRADRSGALQCFGLGLAAGVPGFGEPVACAADRETLLVQQVANAADQQNLMVLVIAAIAAPLHRLELREFLIPIEQHVRLDAAQLAHLTDREVALGGNGWQA